MGFLKNGEWVEAPLIKSDKDGGFDREPRSFLECISPDHERFQPESGRYHLYISYACPWANRTLIFRRLKKLEDHISVSVVHPHMLDHGWSFDSGFDGATGDTLYSNDYLYQIYQKADPKVTTKVTVPVLWDKKNEMIVNNESSEVIRILNTAFNDITGNHDDYYPEGLRTDIDEWNDEIYTNVNNGVYKAGFAQNQKAYDSAIEPLFKTLDKLDAHLKDRPFLVGDQLTEADVRLFVTLIRFDAVYYVHFKCNVRKISEYPNLGRYMKQLYAMPEFQDTIHFDHIKEHYYYSHKMINPFRIVPAGPDKIL